ncbi:MAG: DUF1499 domain-containing protein [Pseudomonadota bacterium]
MTDQAGIAEETPSAGWRGKFAGLALAVAVFSVLWFMAGALGSKYGLWSWQFGLGVMYLGWGIIVAGGALAMSILALIIGLAAAPRKRPVMLSLGALLISGLVAGRLAGIGAGAESLPPLHDIQTDWSDPIVFSETLMAIREADGATNPVLAAPTIPEAAEGRWPGLGGRLVSEVQEEAEFDPETMKEPEDAAYPYSFDTVILEGDLAGIAESAEQVATGMGWEIVTPASTQSADLETQVEAIETSAWFGFKDDIAVRLRAVDEGVAVDVRSTSRVGLSDLGANAKRVDLYLTELKRVAAT